MGGTSRDRGAPTPSVAGGDDEAVTTTEAAPSSADPADLARPVDDAAVGVTSSAGTIELVGGALVLVGDIGTHLCQEFRAIPPTLGDVDTVDARRVTFLGSPGLSLLAAVARARGVGVPLWVDHHAVLRPLTMVGLDHLFDIHLCDAGGAGPLR